MRKKIHQFPSSIKKDASKRKLVLFSASRCRIETNGLTDTNDRIAFAANYSAGKNSRFSALYKFVCVYVRSTVQSGPAQGRCGRRTVRPVSKRPLSAQLRRSVVQVVSEVWIHRAGRDQRRRLLGQGSPSSSCRAV